MTVTKQLTIWCDRDGCELWVAVDEVRIREAWAELRRNRYSWVRRGHGDFCCKAHADEQLVSGETEGERDG